MSDVKKLEEIGLIGVLKKATSLLLCARILISSYFVIHICWN
jgi:hypothetical protein